MARTHADYVYRNTLDDVRIRIFRTEQGWDFDVYLRNGAAEKRTGLVEGSYVSNSAISHFRTKLLARAEAENLFGKMISINPPSIITEGW